MFYESWSTCLNSFSNNLLLWLLQGFFVEACFSPLKSGRTVPLQLEIFTKESVFLAFYPFLHYCISYFEGELYGKYWQNWKTCFIQDIVACADAFVLQSGLSSWIAWPSKDAGHVYMYFRHFFRLNLFLFLSFLPPCFVISYPRLFSHLVLQCNGFYLFQHFYLMSGVTITSIHTAWLCVFCLSKFRIFFSIKFIINYTYSFSFFNTIMSSIFFSEQVPELPWCSQD
jgi:hypothetical protein